MHARLTGILARRHTRRALKVVKLKQLAAMLLSLLPPCLALGRLQQQTFQIKANRLTQEAGHGRFRCRDGIFVDIGGSTGGYTRTVLYDWTPPNLTKLDIL